MHIATVTLTIITSRCTSNSSSPASSSNTHALSTTRRPGALSSSRISTNTATRNLSSHTRKLSISSVASSVLIHVSNSSCRKLCRLQSPIAQNACARTTRRSLPSLSQ